MSKKILAVILTAALIVTAAACGGNNEETTTTTTTPAETTTEIVEDVTDVEEEAEDEEADAPAAEDETTEDETTTDGAASDLSCQALSDVVINSGIEFPAIGLVEDEAILTDVLGYDLSLFSEYSITMHMMSAHLIELTIVKPADGQKDAALEHLNNRMNQLKTEVAFYPEQQETADQTVVGEAGDYLYLLCCNDAAKAEEALKAAVGA